MENVWAIVEWTTSKIYKPKDVNNVMNLATTDAWMQIHALLFVTAPVSLAMVKPPITVYLVKPIPIWKTICVLQTVVKDISLTHNNWNVNNVSVHAKLVAVLKTTNVWLVNSHTTLKVANVCLTVDQGSSKIKTLINANNVTQHVLIVLMLAPAILKNAMLHVKHAVDH